MEPDVYHQCIDDDDDVEFYDCDFEIGGSDIKADENGGGRVLPSWSVPGIKG